MLPKKPSYYRISDKNTPDVWVPPCVVLEVSLADLSLSSDFGSGLSSRFPAFIRVRDDKKPEDATTDRELQELYYS